jgi:hypothetical protein
MFIPLVLGASLLIALARGGRVTNLAQIPLHHIGLLFTPLLIQLVAFSPIGDMLVAGTPLAQYLYATSLAVAALALAFNRHLPGVVWIAAGLALNAIAIFANGGFMPVAASAREFAGLPPLTDRDLNVISTTDSTRLPFLTDILPLPAFLPFANVFSIGDVLVTVGGVIFIQSIVPPTRRTEPQAD